ANMNPKPPHHPSYAARRPVGAPRASRIHGTRATWANHHRDGAGKARTGRAPTTTAAAERYHGEASQWPSVFIGASLPPEDPSVRPGDGPGRRGARSVDHIGRPAAGKAPPLLPHDHLGQPPAVLRAHRREGVPAAAHEVRGRRPLAVPA